MPRRSSLHGSDLRGAVRLATDATAGLTDLVEAMHARIAQLRRSLACLNGFRSRYTGTVGTFSALTISR